MKLLFNAGDRVYMRVRPANTGTVARVSADGFTVVFDYHDRKPCHPRSRFTYSWQTASAFIPGNPPSAQE